MFIEISLLFVIGVSGSLMMKNGLSETVLAGILLFSMGVQNSLVTQISNSTVRTTHLTGLFTDLGIELSQLFFYKRKVAAAKINAKHRTEIGHYHLFFYWLCYRWFFIFSFVPRDSYFGFCLLGNRASI